MATLKSKALDLLIQSRFRKGVASATPQIAHIERGLVAQCFSFGSPLGMPSRPSTISFQKDK